ncbi:MAG: HD-GYP domain-containing protein, partial [Spirochaetes bacterium]|nr:HD-GYP domain-containing protein [Spirochaetota bacterium]
AISTMNKIDRAVLSSLSRFSLVENVTAIVSELFTDLEVFLAMADEDNKRYHVLVGNNLARRSESVNSFYVDFEKLGEEIIAGNYYFYSLSHEENEDVLSELNSLFGTEYFYMMNIPIYIEETYVASLVLGREKDVPFTDFETDTSIAIADQVGVAMKSLRYIERIESLFLGMFLGILKALSKTIDAKSKWTYGHSERVAKYSEAIARAMNLNDEFIHNITISASLHDIGKIGVSENILDKRGTLTSEEFGAIKNHPVEGAEILEVIPGYEKFISGIIYHHEHYDGNGYPFGLKEEEIPLMGRIIAVADVFDSLVSDRPYRKGMSVEEAKEILKQERGKKLDPAIVDIILQIV